MHYGQQVKTPPNPGGYTTVWIDPEPGREVEIYRCHKCGTAVFEHGGNISSTVPSYHQSTLPLIKMCPNRNCKRKYVIRLGSSSDRQD